MTQTQRVLKALEAAGPTGISQGDFLLPDVIDGGKPITRVGARIKDLRNDGHAIETKGERSKFTVYVLVSAEAAEADLELEWKWPPRPAATEAIYS